MMITAAHVQAHVVNIGNQASALPPRLVADANILYWVFYPNFASLAYAGGRLPLSYQISTYPGYWVRAAGAGCQLFTANATIGEFAKVSEYAELEARWLTDPSRPQPDPANPVTRFDARVCKFARYHDAASLGAIRRGLETVIASIFKSVALLDLFSSAMAQHSQADSVWLSSLADFPDAVLVASALNQGVDCILSDDTDFATFPSITLYTANRRTIAAARTAGRLV
jgi:hypothetical protein